MNPAGKKYGGRSKLPENLKNLFRPVAMSKPDNPIIAEAMLVMKAAGAKILLTNYASCMVYLGSFYRINSTMTGVFVP